MSKPIIILDHADRLNRLTVMGADREQIDEELDKVCQSVFGKDLDDIDDDVFAEMESDLDAEATRRFEAKGGRPVDWAMDDYKVEAIRDEVLIEIGLGNGFDIRHPTTKALISEAFWFAMMAWAKERGLFADTPEKKLAARLKRDALDFTEDRKDGVIRG